MGILEELSALNLRYSLGDRACKDEDIGRLIDRVKRGLLLHQEIEIFRDWEPCWHQEEIEVVFTRGSGSIMSGNIFEKIILYTEIYSFSANKLSAIFPDKRMGLKAIAFSKASFNTIKKVLGNRKDGIFFDWNQYEQLMEEKEGKKYSAIGRF